MKRYLPLLILASLLLSAWLVISALLPNAKEQTFEVALDKPQVELFQFVEDMRSWPLWHPFWIESDSSSLKKVPAATKSQAYFLTANGDTGVVSLVYSNGVDSLRFVVHQGRTDSLSGYLKLVNSASEPVVRLHIAEQIAFSRKLMLWIMDPSSTYIWRSGIANLKQINALYAQHAQSSPAASKFAATTSGYYSIALGTCNEAINESQVRSAALALLSHVVQDSIAMKGPEFFLFQLTGRDSCMVRLGVTSNQIDVGLNTAEITAHESDLRPQLYVEDNSGQNLEEVLRAFSSEDDANWPDYEHRVVLPIQFTKKPDSLSRKSGHYYLRQVN